MTSTPKTPNWFDISMDAWALAAESNMVIAMRMGSLALGGPNAAREAERMVTEKVAANMALGCDLMRGKLGSSPEAIVSGSIAVSAAAAMILGETSEARKSSTSGTSPTSDGVRDRNAPAPWGWSR